MGREGVSRWGDLEVAAAAAVVAVDGVEAAVGAEAAVTRSLLQILMQI